MVHRITSAFWLFYWLFCDPLFSFLFSSPSGSSVRCSSLLRIERVCILVCAAISHATAGDFISGTTAPPPTSDFLSAGGGKARSSASLRRQRVRQAGQSEALLRLQRHADALRDDLAHVRQELVIEKERRNAISAEHFSISQSLQRAQQLLEEERAAGQARAQAITLARSAEFARERADRDQRHQLELRSLKDRSELLKERAALDAQTSQALVGRLRQERNQARQDALRYNQERNEARAEIVELRAHHSAAAVRSALAPIFPPSAE